MNYSILKQNIDDYITTNGDNDITGQVMREQLNAIITSLGAGYQYIGVATTSTNPGSPDYKCFYIATQVGTYANFGSGGLTVADGEVAIFYWDTAWHKAVTGAASKAQLDELGQEVSVYFPGWEIGNIYISTSGWTYSDSTTRVRLAQGQSLHLFPGDLVGLTDYTSAEYYIGWKRANGTYGTMARWLSGDMTIGEEGDYVFIFRAKPEASVAQASDLSGLFFIKSLRAKVDENEENIKDIAATGCGILAAQANTNGSTSMYLPLPLTAGKTYYIYISEQNGVGYNVDNIETISGGVVLDQILLTAGKITAKPFIIK